MELRSSMKKLPSESSPRPSKSPPESSDSTRASLLESPSGGELCAFLERLLEEHHARLLRDLEVLVHRNASVPSVLVEEDQGEQAWEDSGNSAPFSLVSARHSYDTDQLGKRRSAKQAQVSRRLSPSMEMRFEKSQSLVRTKSCCARFVNSTAFELMSCLLIVVNAAFFGVEAQLASTMAADEGREEFFWAIGLGFTFMISMEIILRIAFDQQGFWCSKKNVFWHVFDISILLASLLELGLPLAGLETKTSLTHVRIVRVARTVKALRIVRLLSIFDSLRILVNSVINTLRSLVWTLVLLAVILYLFGLLFTNATLEELREGRVDEEQAKLLQRHFGTLFRSVYTLFQAITNGVSWAPVAEVLGKMHPAWEFLFSAFVMFIYFAVLNVVTGVFCQTAIESANQDKDTLVQAQLSIQRIYTEQLQVIFNQIDEDSTGLITLNMLEEALQDDQVKAYFDGLDLTTDDAWHLFQLMDKNASNSIDLHEFVEGCLRLRGRARSIDIHMLMHQSEWTMKRLSDVLDKLALMQALVGPRQLSMRSSSSRRCNEFRSETKGSQKVQNFASL